MVGLSQEVSVNDFIWAEDIYEFIEDKGIFFRS